MGSLLVEMGKGLEVGTGHAELRGIDDPAVLFVSDGGDGHGIELGEGVSFEPVQFLEYEDFFVDENLEMEDGMDDGQSLLGASDSFGGEVDFGSFYIHQMLFAEGEQCGMQTGRMYGEACRYID